MPRPALGTIVVVAALALAVGCERAPEATTTERPPAPVPTTTTAPSGGQAEAEAAAAEAKVLFETRCATCHGPQGAGDGPASAGLTPRPRDLQDPEWQRSVTEEHLEKVIQFGGAAVGKSPAMPGNPDLVSKPDVVAALVAHIRGLAKK